MTRAKYERTCLPCGLKISIGEEIVTGPGGWVHQRCAAPPRPAGNRWQRSCLACNSQQHGRDVQERINERGSLKVSAAMAGNIDELDRLAALTPSCLQSDEEWYKSTYGALTGLG